MNKQNSQQITVRAPSNIALIKYMGKSDLALNLAASPSLSMTLKDLCTVTELKEIDGPSRIVAELPGGAPSFTTGLSLQVPRLSEKGIHRMLAHVARVQGQAPESFGAFGLKTRQLKGLEIRSANTFPEGTGIASSASSFAAVTLGVAALLAEDLGQFKALYSKNQGFRRSLSQISRQGSGSSCRSFEGPWVAWKDERTWACESKTPELADLVLLVSDAHKEVGSSEAHRRVLESPLWEGRVARVEKRFEELQVQLRQGDLRAAALLSWQEAWEMHSLFHTAREPFTYWAPQSMEILKYFSEVLRTDAHPPIVTMDAGPNLHVLVPVADEAAWTRKITERFPGLRILRDHCGTGAEIVL